MLIYIRHGDDRDDDDHRHDRRLTDRGRRRARKIAKRLIERYGHPSAAFVSPYRRTLETLEAMSDRFEAAVTVRRDPRIAQHLKKKQQRAPDISGETLRAKVPIAESREDLQRRVDQHVEDAQLLSKSSVVWCVTHAIVIEHVADRLDVKMPDHLDFLDHVVIK